MFYIGVALSGYGVLRLATAVLGTIRLDRQVGRLDYYGRAIRRREIEVMAASNRLSFYWALVALSVGPILIHAATR